MSAPSTGLVPVHVIPPLRRRPASDPTRRPKASEQEFYDFILGHFPEAEYEPEMLETARGAAGNLMEAITPDIRLEPDLFLELTSADRYPRLDTLPLAIQRKNKHHSRSGRAHISPDEYLERKLSKIIRAELIHGVSILLLNGALQDEIMACPRRLDELITVKLDRLTAPAPLLTAV